MKASERKLNSWIELESELRLLETQRREGMDPESAIPSEFLYRGQSDSQWPLETSLERLVNGDASMLQYYRSAYSALPEIQAFTGRRWDHLPIPNEYENWLDNRFDAFMFREFAAYEYLAYLRHHGFPSPLLDWSASPYIAAFFAFRHARPDDKNGSVAIFVYQEMPQGLKVSGSDHPNIYRLGAYTKTHQRHFLQQSNYTVCINGRGKDAKYVSHEDGGYQGENSQDALLKFIVPSSEKPVALEALSTMNITAYSLFATEDSLIESIASKLLYSKSLPFTP